MFCLHYSVIYNHVILVVLVELTCFLLLTIWKQPKRYMNNWYPGKRMFSTCTNSENKSWLPFLISSKEHEVILNWRSNYEGTASQKHSKDFTKHICSGEHGMDKNQVLLLNLCMF